MTTTAFPIDTLYRPPRVTVEFVDVPTMDFLVVPGVGAPEGPAFATAVQALYAVSYGAHFLVRKAFGEAPRVMPLEALWWVGDDQQAGVEAVVRGEGTMADTDRDLWHWQAMILQPEPIDAAVVAEATALARAKSVTGLDRVSLQKWEEGRCAQLLHVGPYADEGPSIDLLHRAIGAMGLRPHGRHHEIYLGDPRRSRPERLRTILRQPVEPA
jgi:hypothetical protein